MAAPKKSIKTVLEEPLELTEETVTLSEAYAHAGSIIAKHGIIEFINGKAVVSNVLAAELRQHRFIK